MKADLITIAVLEGLAGATAFRRGEEYFSVGAVGCLRVTADKITARVEGNESYQVELRDDDGDLAYDCTCPRAAGGKRGTHESDQKYSRSIRVFGQPSAPCASSAPAARWRDECRNAR